MSTAAAGPVDISAPQNAEMSPLDKAVAAAASAPPLPPGPAPDMYPASSLPGHGTLPEGSLHGHVAGLPHHNQPWSTHASLPWAQPAQQKLQQPSSFALWQQPQSFHPVRAPWHATASQVSQWQAASTSASTWPATHHVQQAPSHSAAPQAYTPWPTQWNVRGGHATAQPHTWAQARTLSAFLTHNAPVAGQQQQQAPAPGTSEAPVQECKPQAHQAREALGPMPAIPRDPRQVPDRLSVPNADKGRPNSQIAALSAPRNAAGLHRPATETRQERHSEPGPAAQPDSAGIDQGHRTSSAAPLPAGLGGDPGLVNMDQTADGGSVLDSGEQAAGPSPKKRQRGGRGGVSSSSNGPWRVNTV